LLDCLSFRVWSILLSVCLSCLLLLLLLLLFVFVSQLLHLPESERNERWNLDLSALLRAGASRSKQLAAASSQGTAAGGDIFCARFLDFFQTYLQVAAQVLASIGDWQNEAYKVLDYQEDCSLLDLKAFVANANGKTSASSMFCYCCQPDCCCYHKIYFIAVV
jgi:hypothetical protein